MLLKVSHLYAAVLCVLALPVHADIITVTGDTTGKPTYNRALEDFSALSPIGTAVHYDTLSFTVSVFGDYTFLTTGSFDTFTFLYSPSFDPANGLSNGLIASDDLLSGFTTSGFAFTLNPGTNYVFVTTGFDSPDFGEHSTTIGGPGVIITTVVPEPGSYGLFALGLGALMLHRRRQPANA